MIFFVIIICIIIILGIKKYKEIQEDRRREEYIKKQEYIERQENIRKQENLRRQESIRQKENAKKKESTKQQENYYPYHKKYLLTKNEYYFYKKLKNITEPLNLQILAKIRLADLIEVNKGLDQSEWGKYFSKIKSKHIDFAVTDDMKIILLIELDDNSHNNEERQNRDLFVNKSLSKSGYKVIRTFGDVKEIEQDLINKGGEKQ